MHVVLRIRGHGEAYRKSCDEKGRRMDHRALLLVSRTLGHNRVNVVAWNYLLKNERNMGRDMCMMIYIFTVYYIELYFATVLTEISRIGVG